MLKNLIKIASDLDAAGFKKEADLVDLIIRKVSSSMTQDEDADDGIPADVASEEEIQALWNEEVTPEERRFYDEVQAKVLKEIRDSSPDDESELPSAGDEEDFYNKFMGQTEVE